MVKDSHIVLPSHTCSPQSCKQTSIYETFARSRDSTTNSPTIANRLPLINSEDIVSVRVLIMKHNHSTQSYSDRRHIFIKLLKRTGTTLSITTLCHHSHQESTVPWNLSHHMPLFAFSNEQKIQPSSRQSSPSSAPTDPPCSTRTFSRDFPTT